MKPTALVLFAILAAPGPVLAENLVASDARAIAAAMQDFGYRAELTTDNEGDPLIKSAAGGANFSVYFYGCSAGKHCQSIQFSAGFDLADGTSLEVANDWNARKRFAKTYLDQDMDPYLEMDVNLAYGGVTAKNFADTLDSWDKLLADFKTHINW